MGESANHRRDIWLPPDFLAGEELMFMHRDSLTRTGFDHTFPASFGSPVSSFELQSAFESVLGSIETQGVTERLLTELTRRLSRSGLLETALSQRNLENPWFVPGGNWSSGAPLFRNTRSPYGPHQFPPPPVGDFNDPWNQMCAAAAAGNAARRKMNGFVPPLRNRCLAVPPANHRLPPVNSNAGYCTCQCVSHNFPQPPNHLVHARQDQALMKICSSIWGRPPTRETLISDQQPPIAGERAAIGGDLGGPPEPACLYPQSQNRTHRNLPPVRGGSEGKREIAGTGVFIPSPRSYGDHLGTQKKTVPVRAVQTPNRDMESITRQTPPSFNVASPPDYDDMLASLRMQRVPSQKAEGLGGSKGSCLPQEWTY